MLTPNERYARMELKRRELGAVFSSLRGIGRKTTKVIVDYILSLSKMEREKLGRLITK